MSPGLTDTPPQDIMKFISPGLCRLFNDSYTNLGNTGVFIFFNSNISLIYP